MQRDCWCKKHFKLLLMKWSLKQLRRWKCGCKLVTSTIELFLVFFNFILIQVRWCNSSKVSGCMPLWTLSHFVSTSDYFCWDRLQKMSRKFQTLGDISIAWNKPVTVEIMYLNWLWTMMLSQMGLLEANQTWDAILNSLYFCNYCKSVLVDKIPVKCS